MLLGAFGPVLQYPEVGFWGMHGVALWSLRALGLRFRVADWDLGGTRGVHGFRGLGSSSWFKYLWLRVRFRV